MHFNFINYIEITSLKQGGIEMTKKSLFIFMSFIFLSFNASYGAECPKKISENDFFESVKQGDLQKVVCFVSQKGAKVDARDRYGRTALMEASAYGHLEMLKFLVAQGADVNAESNTDSTALHTASWFWPHQEGLSISDIGEQKLEIIKFLISKGADVNAENDFDRTALINASIHGHLEMLKFLVSQGAKVNVRDNDGRRALFWASERKDEKMIAFLKSKGAKQ